MTFERTADYPLLNSLLRSSRAIATFLGDDFAPAIEEAAVVEHPLAWYILASDDDGILGFWMFEARSTIQFDFHTVMPLNRPALRALCALLGPGGWLWANSPCLRAETFVPASNKIALRFGLRAGLKEFGRSPRSYMKGGRLEDRVLLGINKD